jgi:nicotinamide-nucleotide amidase
MSVPSSPPRRAVIIAVGSELLTPFRTDTNSLFITSALNELGIEVVAKLVVGDRREELAATIGESLRRSDLVVLTGGLGPTDDDVTRLAVSDALDLPLDEDPAIVERIRQRFERRGQQMPAVNRVQAQVLSGATVLPNPNGTAPGQWIQHGGRTVALLPGPPREMRPMLEAALAERIETLARGARLYRRVLKIAGRTESDVEQVAQPVYSSWTTWQPPVSTSILAAPGQIELHFSIRAASEEEGRAILGRATEQMLAVVGRDVYSTDGRSLERVVGDLLRARSWRIATAESCTGGLVASRLTDVAGSSDYFERGVVAYSNRAKTQLLDVPEELIREHGAVSEPVGVSMASGMRERASVDIAVGITGIAGPGGGNDQKPVGTVVVAAVSPAGTEVRRFLFLGGREQVKFQASQAALDMVRRILEHDGLPLPGR